MVIDFITQNSKFAFKQDKNAAVSIFSNIFMSTFSTSDRLNFVIDFFSKNSDYFTLDSQYSILNRIRLNIDLVNLNINN